jgi:plastocyanin
MMRRSLFCFSLGVSLAFGWAQASTVSGTIELSANGHKPREQSNHLSDVVVWLEALHAAPIPERPLQHAQLLQKDKMFRPHVLPVVAGTAVDFPNADPIFHNAFSNYDGQLFDVALYAPGASRTVVFRKPGVARVFCNIHPSMSAIILVLTSPHFARVNANGQYQITNVPPGIYELHFFDERSSEASHRPIQLNVDNASAVVNAPALHIVEGDYVSLPHKNKYGQDYAPNSNSYGGSMGPPK